MTRFEEMDQLQREIERLETNVRLLAREALRRRPVGGSAGESSPAYDHALSRYEEARLRLVEKKNELRRMLGERPLTD